jgi:dUTP pyrophosphatase
MLTISLQDDDSKLMPTRAHEGDAGVDLRSTQDITIHPGAAEFVNTGVKIAIPYGYVGLAFSRSGHGKPEIRVSLSNSVGVIDHQYRGYIQLVLENRGQEDFIIKKYDRIGQLALLPVWLANSCLVSENYFDDKYGQSSRGAAGFGSSGTK